MGSASLDEVRLLVLFGLALIAPIACGLDVVGVDAVAGSDSGVSTPTTLVDGAVIEEGDASSDGPVTLTVSVPNAGGVVTSDVGKISCPPDCSATLPQGTNVTLTARRDPAVGLREWSGACLGREPRCSLTLARSASVTATFAPVVHYMHTEHALYTVAHVNGQTGKVGDFKGDCNGGMVVGDMALDRNGKAWATSFTNDDVFKLDLANATCARIGNLGVKCNGLGFAPDPAAPAADVLYASCTQSLFRVSLVDGNATLVGAPGAFGNGNDSSGDIAYVPGRGMFVAIVSNGNGDRLARVDLTNGKLTIMGPMGRNGIWGLGYRDDRVVAYLTNAILLVDPGNGSSTHWNDTGLAAVGGASSP